MGKTYVLSDTHFWHGKYKTDERGILAFTDRPFDDIETMNEVIFEQIRSTLNQDDTLFFLGDLYFGVGTNRKWMVDRWREIKVKYSYWILGNHDEPDRCPDLAGMFTHVLHAHSFKAHKANLYFSHYPLHVPHADTKRLISIHGHNHGTVDNVVGRIDVGIDNLYAIRDEFDPQYFFGPITLETAIELARRDIPSRLKQDENTVYAF